MAHDWSIIADPFLDPSIEMKANPDPLPYVIQPENKEIFLRMISPAEDIWCMTGSSNANTLECHILETNNKIYSARRQGLDRVMLSYLSPKTMSYLKFLYSEKGYDVSCTNGELEIRW